MDIKQFPRKKTLEQNDVLVIQNDDSEVTSSVAVEDTLNPSRFGKTMQFESSGGTMLLTDTFRVKNLLKVTATSQTINGVTFTVNSDGTITVNGTANSNINYVLTPSSVFGKLTVGTYILHGCPLDGSVTTYLLRTGGADVISERDTGNGVIFSYDGLGDIGFVITIFESTVCNNLVFKPMLELIPDGADESEYPHEYVPYGQTKAEVTVKGRNLIDCDFTTKTINGITFTVNSDRTVTVNGTATSDTRIYLVDDMSIYIGKKFYLSGCPVGGNASSGYSIAAINCLGGYQSTYDTSSGTIFTVQSSTYEQYIIIILRSGTTVSNLTFKPMLELIPDGADETSYPHAYESCQSHSLTLTNQDTEPIAMPCFEGVNNLFSDTYLTATYPVNETSEAVLEMGEKLDENVILKTIQGETFSIPDTLPAPMLMTDWTKNLLKVTATSQTINGVTFTVNSDGTITVNGTANSNINYVLTPSSVFGKLTVGTYILHGCPLDGSVTTYLLRTGGADVISERDTGNGVIFSYDGLGDIGFVITIFESTVCNNLVFKPMLELIPDGADESEYPHPYVPYAGYEVKSISGNLLNYAVQTLTANGATFTVNADKSITFSGTPTSSTSLTILRDLKVSPGEKYEYSMTGTFKNVGLSITTTKSTGGADISNVYSTGSNIKNTLTIPENGISLSIDVKSNYSNTAVSGTATLYLKKIVTAHVTNDTEAPVLLESFEGETNVQSPSTVEVNYAATKKAAGLLNKIGQNAEEIAGKANKKYYWDDRIVIDPDNVGTADTKSILIGTSSGALPSNWKTGSAKDLVAAFKAASTKYMFSNKSYTFNMGENNIVVSEYSMVNGRLNTASGYCSHAYGESNTASGGYSHAYGYLNTASGNHSHAYGHLNTASGNHSHAYGHTNTASEGYSHAYGYLNTASGGYSHAYGHTNTASGYCSHAYGHTNTASGYCSHAYGESNAVVGDPSKGGFAFGYQNFARGAYAYIEGYSTNQIYANADKANYTSALADMLTVTSATESTDTVLQGLLTTWANTKKFSMAYGNYSHVEGKDNIAANGGAHAEGAQTRALGYCSHAEGENGSALGEASHKEGIAGSASGMGAHSEGASCVASGAYSHAGGHYSEATAECAFATGDTCTASGSYSFAEGYNCQATNQACHAEGNSCTAMGENSHAEGNANTASGGASHAEGATCTASSSYSHAGGKSCTASGIAAFAHGQNCLAGGSYSIAMGYNCKTNAYASVVIGDGINTIPSTFQHCNLQGTAHTYAIQTSSVQSDDYYASSDGHDNIVRGNQRVIGHYSKFIGASAETSGVNGVAFIVGNGTSSTRNNCFRVNYSGQVYSQGAYSTSGADYAEMFEWLDGNPDKEDRVGKFVTMDGDKIKIADSESDYILGVVSGSPVVLGNGDPQWSGEFKKDVFGRFIYEDVEEEIKVFKELKTEDEDGNPLEEPEEIFETVTTTGKGYVHNPNYDPDAPYIQRLDRPEWDAIGMLGVLPAYDDGTCTVNGYCKCSDEGIATAAIKHDTVDSYRVIERVEDNIIKIVLK